MRLLVLLTLTLALLCACSLLYNAHLVPQSSYNGREGENGASHEAREALRKREALLTPESERCLAARRKSSNSSNVVSWSRRSLLAIAVGDGQISNVEAFARRFPSHSFDIWLFLWNVTSRDANIDVWKHAIGKHKARARYIVIPRGVKLDFARRRPRSRWRCIR